MITLYLILNQVILDTEEKKVALGQVEERHQDILQLEENMKVYACFPCFIPCLLSM